MTDRAVGNITTATTDGRATLSREAALRKLFSRLGELSSLPAAAQRVASLADDQSTSAKDLLQVVEGDAPLVAKILRRVNSSCYSLRRRVADLPTALTVLGVREIRNLALTGYVSRIFEKGESYRVYSREHLWQHMVGVAATARVIAQSTGSAAPEEAYVGGLLHDIGMILLDQHLHKHFRQLIDRLDEVTPTTQLEQAIFSFDHAQLGAFVAKQWDFPPQVVAAIQHHHAPDSYQGPHAGIVRVVALANYLVSDAGSPSLGVHNLPPVSESLYRHLGLSDEKLASVKQRLESILTTA